LPPWLPPGRTGKRAPAGGTSHLRAPGSAARKWFRKLLALARACAVERENAIAESGLPGYDEAVERAIRRTDPFPRRRDGTVERTVIIRFRPVDAQ